MTTDTQPHAELWSTGYWPMDAAAQCTNQEQFDFLLHSPIAWRLRNEAISREYVQYADTLRGYVGDGVPNWFDWAAWASSSVGSYIRNYAPGHRRVRRALGVGNLTVFADITPFWQHLKDDEPQAQQVLAEHAGDGRVRHDGAEPSGGDQPAGHRDRRVGEDGRVRPSTEAQEGEEAAAHGIAQVTPLAAAAGCYQLAHQLWEVRPEVGSADDTRRRELILLGNAYIAVHEQQLLQSAIAVMMRSTIRRFHDLALLHPLRSQRQWRHGTTAGRRWLRFEGWLMRRTTGSTKIPLPFGRVRVGSQLQLPSPLTLPEVPDGLGTSPFETYPPTGQACECWADYDQRMAFINALMIVGHQQPEWNEEATRRPKQWAGYEKETQKFIGRFLRDDRAPGAAHQPPAGWQQPGAAELTTPGSDGPDESIPNVFADEQARADLEVSQRLYRANRSWVTVGFLARSIPASFASGKGATTLAPNVVDVKVVAEATDLTRVPVFAGDAGLRAAITLQFVDQLMGLSRTFAPPDDETSSPLGGAADIEEAIRMTRNRHHRHRYLTRKGGWDDEKTQQYGLPANINDMVGTICTFVTPVQELFDDTFRRRISREQWDAWARTWARIGVALGIPASHLQIDGKWLDAAQMSDIAHYYEATHTERSAAGVFLMDNFISDLTDLTPMMYTPLVRRMVRAFGYDDQLRILLVPHFRSAPVMRSVFHALGRQPILGALLYRASDISSRPTMNALMRAGREQPDLLEKFPPTCYCEPRSTSAT